MPVTSRLAADEVAPIGRDAEAARLARLIEDAVAGAKRAALLLGVPGIGKTTLLRYARARAEARGIVSTHVRVPATAGLPPRFPLGELLGGLGVACARQGEAPERLRRVVDTLTGTTSVDEYAVSLPQIADAIEEAGRFGPLGVFIDDYDWAPPEGTDLLMTALRVVETPLCFIASARLRGLGDEPPSPLPAPTADLWIEHVEVRGLDPGAVAVFASGMLGGEILPSLGDALFARTLGNPLFVAETLQAWRERGALVDTGGYWGLREGSAPPDAGSLHDMIVARLSNLPEEALSVAGALAVIGREAGLEEIGSASEVPPERLTDVVNLLDGAGVVSNEGRSRFRIAHPLYVAAVVDHLGEARIACIHGRLCRSPAGRNGGAERPSASELAHHAVRALHPPSDLRATLSAAAAEAESAGSFEEAAVWYGHLAELSDDPRELVVALTGQATASTRADPARAVHLFTCALELEDDAAAKARLLLGRARAHRVAGMFDLAIADLEEALPQADPAEAFDIRHAIGVVHGVRGNLDEAEKVFRSLVEEYADAPERWKAVGHLGLVAFVRGDLCEGSRLQEQALDESSDPAYKTYLRSNLSWMFVLLGRWDEAAEMLKLSLDTAVSAGDIHEEAPLACIAARLAACRGELAESFDFAQRALRLSNRLGNPADMMGSNDALASALMENDMPAEAAAILSRVLELDQPGVEPREFTYTYTVFAEANLLSGDLVRARMALARARRHLDEARFWGVAIERAEAQIELSLGDPLGALRRLNDWLERPTPMVFEQARVLETAAEALWAIGDRPNALLRAQAAMKVYEQLGARGRARRVGQWLVERTSKRPGRPRSNLPGKLTEREMEILQLIVRGRSNREIAEELFISLGTAKKHVENLMAKAAVSRRTELVPFAVSIGVLAVEDLRPGAGRSRRALGVDGSRVIQLDRLEPSEPQPAD